MRRSSARTLRCAVLGTLSVVAVACGDDGGGSAGTPRFVDESATSGIDHRYTGDFEFFVGGGVAALDCDDDGRQDLFLAGGTSPAALYRNESPVGGALRFVPVASPVTDLTDVTGAYPLDIDSDGHADLAVLRRGGNALLRGLGGCEFEDATAAWGVDPGTAWTVGFSATWEGDAALPTLAFGNYLVPDGDTCGDNQLVRPNDAGTAYTSPLPLSPAYCTLSLLFSDWNRTGQRDLRVANDRHYYRDGTEQLWNLAPGATPRVYTEADGWKQLQIWGMGIASTDLTGDGKPEVALTSQGDTKLQSLDDGAIGPSYRDIAVDRGTTAAQPYTGGDALPSTSWHAEFQDLNNDGLVDLFITKGNVEAQVDYASKDPSNVLLGRPDGTFVERGLEAGIATFDRARGAVLVDLNLDGLLDMVVVNRQVPVTVRRNVGAGSADAPKPLGHWLAARLHQAGPNIDAIGAWLQVKLGERVVEREITVGGGHASGSLGWIHVGLGDATSAEVRVQWPDGTTGPWATVTADQFVDITRDAAQPAPWAPQG